MYTRLWMEIAAENWWAVVWPCLWQSSLAAILAMAAVHAFKKRSASFLYAVLMVATIKFLIPPALQLPILNNTAPALTSQTEWPQPITETIASAKRGPSIDPVGGSEARLLPRSNEMSQSVTTRAANVAADYWKLSLFTAHFFGTLLIGMAMIASYLKLGRLLKQTVTLTSGPLYDLHVMVAKRLNVRRSVRLMVSRSACAPIAVGIFSPGVILPDRLAHALPTADLEAILAHELAHHRRLDLAFIWLEKLILLIWWFNPVVWLLVRTLHRTRENCCDDVVLGLKVAEGDAYSDTLLRAARELIRPQNDTLSFGCADNLHPLGRRLVRILDDTVHRSPALTRLGLIGTFAFALVVLPTFLPVAIAVEPNPFPAQPQVPVADTASEQVASSQEAAESPRGTVSGKVTDAATGQPIKGAYVRIDHSGDSGGANLEWIRRDGLLVDDETDDQGRFMLEQVAMNEVSPFLVTCENYVRHQQTLSITENTPALSVDVSLTPGATIDVDLTKDPDGRAAQSIGVRLEDLNGGLFYPIREDWPGQTWRMEKQTDGKVHFSDLREGQYAVDAFGITDRSMTYWGAIPSIEVGTGQQVTAELMMQRRDSHLTVTVEPGPDEWSKSPRLIVITRDTGVLLWTDMAVLHVEDERLGRLQSVALGRLQPGELSSYEFNNFPPGSYAVCAVFILGSGVWVRSGIAEMAEGKETSITLPWKDPVISGGVIRYYYLNRRIQLDGSPVTMESLCKQMTEATEQNMTIAAQADRMSTSITLPAGEYTLWSIIETICREHNWQLREDEGKTLSIIPDSNA
ncbi:MAG: hypothetical protein AMXMBFR84_11100 [Candidatus Hydrogenedentota bacterium]